MQRREFLHTTAALGLGTLLTAKTSAATKCPNILWIVAEDASPHLGCYGERSIKTPNLDLLAAEGVRFENAFVTCPVCSPCRSALVTGMYQTTICSHNHRSQGMDAKRGGNKAYYDSYQLPDAHSACKRLVPGRRLLCVQRRQCGRQETGQDRL